MPIGHSNLDFQDVLLRHNNATHSANKVLLGQNLVWPKSKLVEFKTLQSGGVLEFQVGSTTRYAAVTIDDADVYIFSTANAHKNKIRAQANNYSQNYIMSNSFRPIDISLPLYLKKDVKITGRGTQVGRYGGDYNSGQITVTVRIGIGVSNSFSVQVTGKSTVTKNVPANNQRDFIFSSLSQGNKNVTITNNATGDTYTRTVNVNTSRSSIAPQSFLIGAQQATASTGNIEKSVKIYSLTEAEALANLQASYGNEAIIGVDVRYMLTGNVTNSWNSIWGQSFPNAGSAHTYWVVFFKILHGGSGYPANSRIGIMDMGAGNGVNISYSFSKGYYSNSYFFRHADLITDSNGVITGITRDNYTSYSGDNLSADYMRTSSTVKSRLNNGGYRMDQLGGSFEAPTKNNKYSFSTFGTAQRNDNYYGYHITNSGWRLKTAQSSRGPTNTIPSNLHSSIYYWPLDEDIDYDFYYVSANAGYFGSTYGQSGAGFGTDSLGNDIGPTTDAISYIKAGVEGTNSRKIVFPGANNKNVNLIWTGAHPDGISAQIGTGRFFNNLLLDSETNGSVESLYLGNINLTNILIQNQPEFQVLQSERITTTTDRTGDSRVRINASKKFKAMHGPGIDYSYID